MFCRAQVSNILLKGCLRPEKVLPLTYRTVSTSQNRRREWKDSANTVIIGGGAVGTSLAYHLAKAGQQDVVLLEKLELTAGSTWHAAGLTTAYNGIINVKKLHFYSLQLYEQLEAETGQDVGYHKCGSVRIAANENRLNEFKYQESRQHWNEAEQYLLSRDEVVELCPIINPEHVLAGLYTPNDGHIDPYSLTQALAIGARKYGATLYQNAPVSATKLRHDGKWEVTTPQGTVVANRVINAAGFHAREVGQLAGLDLPMVAIDHQYMVTTTVPEVKSLEKEIPVMRDLDNSYYLRMERSGILFGPYEEPSKMRVCSDWYRQVPPGFGKELFEPDLDRLQWNIEQAMEMFPVLQTAEINRTISGPITYTPDVLPMAGPYLGRRNYWLACGFGYGIAHAGGIAKYITDWVINGEPSFDLVECDPNRFGNWTNEDYVLAKVRETYGMNNAVTWPREERFAGRPTKRNHPLYETLKTRGAEFAFHSGWEQPNWFALDGDVHGYEPSFTRSNWFDPVGREVDMVMNRVGIIDLTPFGKIEVSGPDASRFIDHLCANTLPKVGQTNISHMLTPKGRVYAELTITQEEPNKFFCITGSGSEFHDQRWMEIKAEEMNHNVTIRNVTEDWATLGLAGPKARAVMEKLTDTDVSNEAFPFLHSRDMTLGGVPVKALRISYTGELGWEIYCSMDHLVDLYTALLDAGEEFGIGDFGGFAMGSMRLEKGFRAWGSEMNLDQNPLEAGLSFFVKLKKDANFIGKDALLKVKSEGLKRRLVFLNVDAIDVDAEGNETVWHQDKVVGMTTSGAYSYNTNKSIAFAYVPTELSKPGSEVEVELLGNRCPAVVQKGPPLLIESMRKDNYESKKSVMR